ncbi:unnamed protein product, partial [Ixodes persulcatus]
QNALACPCRSLRRRTRRRAGNSRCRRCCGSGGRARRSLPRTPRSRATTTAPSSLRTSRTDTPTGSALWRCESPTACCGRPAGRSGNGCCSPTSPARTSPSTCPRCLSQSTCRRDVLDRQWYGFVLDRACIQFEPDDPNYIRVTHATYDHIDSQRKFHDLRSTRHFGPMVFYLVVVRRIDNLLVDTLQREMIEDAADLVRLFYHVHPRSDASEVDDRADGVELVQMFTRKDSNKRAHLELAMQTYLEVKSSRDQVSRGLAAARGLQ